MQNYKNHIRYYTPHHFIFYPVVIAGITVCVIQALKSNSDFWLWTFLAVVFVVIGWLSFMLRQHYSLILQNRVVVLEMKFRYFVLTGQKLEASLSFGQVAALRFASDRELPDLTHRAVSENMSPDEIKRSIQDWLPDDNRV